MPRYGLPWIVLVNAGAAWRALAAGKSSAWPALLYQVLLLLFGWMVSRRPMADLAEVSGIGKSGQGLGAFLLGVIALIAGLALLAVLLRLLVKVIGGQPSFAQVFTWLTYGVTPLFVGRILGLLSFAVFQPLAKDKADALALQVNPLGLSLAGLFHQLSLPWTMASAMDAFALWALVILAVGAVQFLRLNAPRAAALIGALLLIWLLALTLVWQGLQRSL